MAYSAYVLTEDARDHLLSVFPPKYDRMVAHHVTYKFPDTTLPPESDLSVVGFAEGDGVQALVVAVNGSTRRPDGGTFHITWSLAVGKKPVQSNDLLKSTHWQSVPAIPITAIASLEK